MVMNEKIMYFWQRCQQEHRYLVPITMIDGESVVDHQNDNVTANFVQYRKNVEVCITDLESQTMESRIW